MDDKNIILCTFEAFIKRGLVKKKSKSSTKITLEDYIKIVKKVDRDIEREQTIGWSRTTNIHKSKKIYDRKRLKNDL